MTEPTFSQLTIEDYSHPYKINNGEENGQIKPIMAIGFEFRTDGKRAGWSAVWLKKGATRIEVADALEKLASSLRLGLCAEPRFGAEVNFDEVKDLMPSHCSGHSLLR